MGGRLFDESQERATLEGVLERVTFTNDENAWSVVKIALPGRRDLVTAVGSLLGVQPGESLRLTGRWIQDRRYGEQFRVESYVAIHPGTLVGIQKYLASGLVRGVGAVMAERLVKQFGLGTLDVIDRSPERLAEVEGIGPVRTARIREAWAEQRGIKDVMIFLQSHGISPAFAIRIYKHYGDRAIAFVKEDPYRLATDIFGIGFRTADRIAASLGIPRDAPRRAEAGILHVLGELSGEGHVFCPLGALTNKASEILEIEPGRVQTAVAPLAREGAIVLEGASVDALTATVANEDAAVFLRSLHVAESGVAARLRAILRAPAPPLTVDAVRAIAWFEAHEGIRLAGGQRAAIERAFASRVLIVTGGPGTGKTTLVNGIIRILERKGRRILLAAPTGRAAKRLEEATGREAKTLHRLLEFSPRSRAFQRDRGHPLEADLVIVDEASMLDVVLAFHLLAAVPDPCQLILVGDVDQIPSVGPGSVLQDLIRSGAADVVRLNEIFRQAERSLIVASAHRINRGEMPALEGAGAGRDFFFVEKDDPAEILATLRTLVVERIPRKFRMDPIDDVQVLTPMHRGLLGAANLNAELQALLNPSGETLSRAGRSFRVGDKVMQVRNNYDLEVFNGDIGRIVALDADLRRVAVRYEDRVVSYGHDDLDEVALAYACSIHKAQGSEYPCVVIPLHTQHYVMLQRNLLYTAVTRGKRLVVLVGSRRALGLAVRNASVAKRYSRLSERLRRDTG